MTRVGRHWIVADAVGELGWLRWRAATNGKPHAVTGQLIRLPTRGVLHVQSLVVSPRGEAKDFGGYVEAAVQESEH